MTASIQPMWEIDENARIFRSCVWFNPPHPPMAIDSRAISRVILELIELFICSRIDIGASFCHVSKISPEVSEIPCVTSGTQKWNGVIPSFMANAVSIMREDSGLTVFIIVHCPEFIVLIIIAIIRIIDAVAWVRKYLVAASMGRDDVFLVRIGMMANIFISRPTQVKSQCELIIVRIVPINRVK